MRSFSWLVACGVLALSSCSGSDGDERDDAAASANSQATGQVVAEAGEPADADAETPVRELDDDEASSLCPDAEVMSAATGIEFTELRGIESEADFAGVDVDSSATLCEFSSSGFTAVAVTIHDEQPDLSFLDADLPGAEVTTLETGLIQLRFEGQLGCELYGDQVSVIAFTDDESIDSCALVAAAHDVTTQG